MSAKRATKDPLFTGRWVHVYEEDTPEGAVYRLEDDDIPLSRRPREQLELQDDGSARILLPGEDDRFVAQPASWYEKDRPHARAVVAGPEIKIVDRSPTRLVVQVSGLKPKR